MPNPISPRRIVDRQVVETALAAGLFVALLASWHYGYAPAYQAYGKDQREQKRLRTAIKHAEAIIAPEATVADWLAARGQQLAELRRRLPEPSQLPLLLNTVVETVKSGELKLINLDQGNLEPVQDGEGPLMLEGRRCYRLPVTVTVGGRYHTVLRTIDRLMHERFPIVMGLERVEMRIDDPLGAVLQAAIQLSLYVAGTPPNG